MTGPTRPAPGSQVRRECFVGGEWVRAGGGEDIEVRDCTTEQCLGTVTSASEQQVLEAVRAAESGTLSLSRLTPEERSTMLRSLHESLSERADELTGLVSAEVGTAVRLCRPVQVDSAIGMVKTFADLVESHVFEERVGNALVVRESAGPVGAITPWNFPLFQTVNKLAGALAAGCAVVHKPSELAPLTSFVLAEGVADAGLPLGSYNQLPGRGTTVGRWVVENPGTRVVSFTGSVATGVSVYENCAPMLKRVTLELGGKSASVLLDTEDLEKRVRTSVNRAFMNSGQTCDAWTRLVVPESALDAVAQAIEAAVGPLQLGDPFDPDTRLGPLINESQRARAAGFVSRALEEGATALLGGVARPPFQTGAFFEPTVLLDVTPEMEVAREEVFGPVLAVLTYKTEEEALWIANSTEYGLSGAVWSGDQDRGLRFARQMRSGEVVVNGSSFNPLSPFGGVGRSGLGREMGHFGINEFTELKSVQMPKEWDG